MAYINHLCHQLLVLGTATIDLTPLSSHFPHPQHILTLNNFHTSKMLKYNF